MKKLLIVSTITKAQAKRLIFLFDRFEAQKSWAGRKQGRHKTEDTQPYADRHSFGRSVRFAPTTNGVTYQLEWSNTCSLIHDNAPVSINVFRLKENHLLIRVAPHKTLKLDARSYNREEFAQECTYENFCIDLRPNCVRIEFGSRNFVILRRHITEQAWNVWANDFWKFDQVVEEVDGQLVQTHDNRERFK